MRAARCRAVAHALRIAGFVDNDEVMPDQQLLHFSYDEFRQMIDTITEMLALTRWKPDVIVGLARGGSPALTELSHRLSCRPTGTLWITKTDSDLPFDRGKPVDHGGYLPDPPATKRPLRVLCADDVVSRGDMFTLARKAIKARYGPETDIRYATLCCDRAMMERGEWRDISERLFTARIVDSATTWVVPPWENPHSVLEIERPTARLVTSRGTATEFTL